MKAAPKEGRGFEKFLGSDWLQVLRLLKHQDTGETFSPNALIHIEANHLYKVITARC